MFVEVVPVTNHFDYVNEDVEKLVINETLVFEVSANGAVKLTFNNLSEDIVANVKEKLKYLFKVPASIVSV